jgi:hypothetical protein
MSRLTSLLTLFLSVIITCGTTFSADPAHVLSYHVSDSFGDHLCDYCYEVASGVHWYEWVPIGNASAVLAAFDGKGWSVTAHRTDFASGVSEVSLFNNIEKLDKRPKLVRSDDPSDKTFQPYGRRFYPYAPVDAFLAELDIENGDLTKLASAVNATAVPSRELPFALARSLKPGSKNWTMRGVMAADGFPSTFVVERGDTVVNRSKTPEPRLLKFRRTETNVGPWDVESRLDSEAARRASQREFSDE